MQRTMTLTAARRAMRLCHAGPDTGIFNTRPIMRIFNAMRRIGLFNAAHIGYHAASRGVAQPGSATVLGTVGREFESLRPDHFPSLNIDAFGRRALCLVGFVFVALARRLSPPHPLRWGVGAVAALWLGLGTVPGLAQDAGLAPANGAVILTLTGQLDHTNAPGSAVLDEGMLRAMGVAGIATKTIWTDGMQTFEGVPLITVLRAVGAQGSMVRVTALNDYSVDIPMDEITPAAPLLALTMNGVAMSPRDKGPIWLVYPYDADAAYRQEVVYARSIWQMMRIEVLP